MDFSPQPAPAIFPPVKQLFKDSWDNLIAKLLPVFIFNAIAVGIGAACFILLFIVLIGTVSLLSLGSSLLLTLPILLLFIVWFVVVFIILSVFQIGNILVLNGNTGQPSYKGILRQSLSLFLPFTIGQILVALLVFGGLFLFIIPGIIFTLFFQFVMFLIILDKLSPKAALKRSAFLASKAFGQIFVRLLLLYLIAFLFSPVLNIITGYSLDEATLTVINGIFSLFFSFFSISYTLTLFKQVKAYSGEGSNNIRFLALVSVVGWIIGVTIMILAFRTLGATSAPLSIPSLPTTLPSDFEEELLLDDAEPLSTPSATPVVRASSVPVSTASATPR